MSNLISFHGDPAVKIKYLTRVEQHAAADRLVQGIGWENGKGCAIGCTLESYDHSRYPIELGLPEWLARLEDHLFERLPRAEAMTWPARFLAAIPVGVNVEPVRHRLAIRRLDRLIALQTAAVGKHGTDMDRVLDQVIAAVTTVRDLHSAEESGKTCDWSAAESAARSAESARSAAARSAESAARSAESAAESAESAAESAESAESAAAWAAWAAWSAESAAESAAWSARSAAWSARSAESAAYKQEATDLLELLAACK